jgi:hypothetical protein
MESPRGIILIIASDGATMIAWKDKTIGNVIMKQKIFLTSCPLLPLFDDKSTVTICDWRDLLSVVLPSQLVFESVHDVPIIANHPDFGRIDIQVTTACLTHGTHMVAEIANSQIIDKFMKPQKF